MKIRALKKPQVKGRAIDEVELAQVSLCRWEGDVELTHMFEHPQAQTQFQLAPFMSKITTIHLFPGSYNEIDHQYI